MKKVWILEKFASREEMLKHQEDNKAMVEMAKASGDYTAEQIASLEDFVVSYNKVVENNPNGRWYGFEGKIKYSDFCYTAKAALRRNPEGKFRVVEGEIPDDSKTWIAYKLVKVNEGVLRYLMATK